MKPLFVIAILMIVLGFGYNIYLGYTLPREPNGAQNQMINLGKGPKVFGTERENFNSEISKWTAITGIACGILATAWTMRARANAAIKSAENEVHGK